MAQTVKCAELHRELYVVSEVTQHSDFCYFTLFPVYEKLPYNMATYDFTPHF